MTPDKYTIQETFIEVGDGHTLYVYDWGNIKSKKPIIFLHGGPGSSVNDKFKMNFDPEKNRVIFFDQRGCGKSTPHGSLENNNTEKSISDITFIADSLKFDKFYLFGGSWGSCLALAYAIKNNDRLLGLILNGIFTGSVREIDWINQGYVKTFFPERWQEFIKSVPSAFKDNPIDYYYEKIEVGSKEEVKEAAYKFSCFEGSVMSLDDRYSPKEFETYDESSTLIELQYLKNLCYMTDRHIINNASKISVPVWIIQGRYDNVCPPITAYELHEKLPNSHIIWTISGHDFSHEDSSVVKGILSVI